MKVLVDGSVGDPEVWREAVTCHKQSKRDGGCGAVFEAGPKDLVVMYWKGTLFNHYYLAVQCPQCGKYNAVYGVPEHIWEEVNNPENRKNAIFDGFSARSN
jgi:hypothetical protein